MPHERFKCLFSLIAKYRIPNKERTIFALGGRGYYENATSDMLAFFLRPDEEHGFGTLFLCALFECMVKEDFPNLASATVEREIKTAQGNRIDLQILGDEWCLLVENKIWHIPNNPFRDYEAHAKKLRKQTNFVILSPNGESSESGRWRGIKYANYCAALRHRIGQASFDAPHSKWHLFAREFVLHLENELYNPVMTEEQASFIEENTAVIAELKKLESSYREFLQQQIRETLSDIISLGSISTKDEGWAIRCYSSQWGKSNLALWRHEQSFMVTAYLVGLTDDQIRSAGTFFQGMKHWNEGAWLAWYPRAGFPTRATAITELTRFSQFFTELFRTPPEPDQPPKTMIQAS